jgi:hypothetical protein
MWHLLEIFATLIGPFTLMGGPLTLVGPQKSDGAPLIETGPFFVSTNLTECGHVTSRINILFLIIILLQLCRYSNENRLSNI